MSIRVFPGIPLALLLGAAFGPAIAHDAWLEARGEEYVVLYGHGSEIEAYDPLKVKTVSALDGKGAVLPMSRQLTASAVQVKVSGSPALSVMFFDDGFWTKTDEGWKNLAKNAVKGDVQSSGYYVQLSKTVFTWGPVVTKPQGLPLEIVPLSATAPAVGKALPVQVLWEGRPLAGAKIARSGTDKPAPIETDAQGKAAIPVPAAGRQILSVAHKHGLKDEPRADQYSASANLVFTAR
ncbi:DUF4198 domain-containing protein [Methylibium sp. Pch-M]|uniref:DUF4198 domain-containing protein n=1 Tax=Methylibium sp. Pch-M TaxID=2082386 RepID=UPI00101302B2|nr:DUF4198 domain-containing protein [Methylibium sp. Pch-M]QAZ38609.1 DUF4198 domain-containing protein [Methylibium sp. Pch-M]